MALPAQPDQVVGRRHQVAAQPSALQVAIARPPEAADSFHSTEDLLNTFPEQLADSVHRVPGGASVDGAPPPRLF